jgi:hypothetical protein
MQCPSLEHGELAFNATRAFYRPRGIISPCLLVDLLVYVLQDVRAKGRKEVLLNLTGISGFDSPDADFRRWAVKRWARAVNGEMRVALVLKPEYICPERSGMVTAAQEGLHAHVTADEREALEWLDVWHRIM